MHAATRPAAAVLGMSAQHCLVHPPVMTAGCSSGNSLRMTSLNSAGNGVSFCSIDAGVMQNRRRLRVHTVPHNAWYERRCRAARDNLYCGHQAEQQRSVTLRKQGGLSTSVVNSLTLPLSTGLPAAAMPPYGRRFPFPLPVTVQLTAAGSECCWRASLSSSASLLAELHPLLVQCQGGHLRLVTVFGSLRARGAQPSVVYGVC
jgi:hypothetical protein